MPKSLGRAFAGSASVIALLATGSALAQDETPPPRDQIIERITVTAERREADVQKVPIPVTAITGDQMDARGIDGFEDLKYAVPSLTFGGQVTGGENFISMRGVGSENLTGGGDSGVAYHSDGVFYGRNVAVDKSFFDVERVEVLRGPQGTLYGRNSTGGAINVITRKPTFDFEAAADVQIGNYDAIRVRAMVNQPIQDDKIALRVAGVVGVHDGYQENLAGAAVCGDCEGDAEDFFNVRGQLRVVLSDNAEIIFGASIYENNEPVATKIKEPFPARFFGPTVVALPNPTDLRKVRKDFDEGTDMDSHTYSATLNWDMEGVTLTSITAYSDLFWSQTTDGDHSELSMALTDPWESKSEQISQEIRLASNSDGPHDWIVGLFLYNENVRQNFLFIDTGLNLLPGNPPAAPLFTFQNGGTIKTNSIAVFGQHDYHMENGLFGYRTTITGGLRFTHDVKNGHDFLNFSGFVQAKDFDNDWDTLTGKIGVQVETSDDVMWYGLISRGYRSGGNLVGNFPGFYDPEYIWNYEVGVKSTLLDGMLQANLSAFHNNYTDIQVFVQDVAASRIENAASATINGFEGEFVLAPTEELTINAGIAWIDATYDNYFSRENRAEFPAPPLTDLSGKRLNRTPEWTVAIGAQYDFVTSIGTISPRIDYIWQDEVFFSAFNLPVDRQGAWHKTDARLTWTDPDDRYSIEAFVENIEDDDVISNMVLPVQTLGGPTTQVTLNPPRTFGVRIGFKY